MKIFEVIGLIEIQGLPQAIKFVASRKNNFYIMGEIRN